jgi:putrescine aminotransferase
MSVCDFHDEEIFKMLRERFSPGTTLAAKIIGSGATEIEGIGARVRLSDGRELIDFGSYGVTLLGHRPPRVIEAVIECLSRMPTATRTLANPDMAKFASALAERCEARLCRLWLGSDGADVVEVALKLARRATGRMTVLAAQGGFHGKTLGALALTSNSSLRGGLEPVLANTVHLDPKDPDGVGRAVSERQVAALVVEPIQGEAGVRQIDAQILGQWCADARSAGAYVISDEIQTGLRRCGPVSVSQEQGLQPDAVLFGKALGGGVLPLAAMVATEELYAPLIDDPTWHTSTYSGHPLACAAGTAALAALDDYAERGRELAAALRAEIDAMVASHQAIVREARGVGLLHGIEFSSAGLAGEVLVGLARRGVLVSPCLSSPRTIRLLPPIVTSNEELDQVMAALRDALGAAEEHPECLPSEDRNVTLAGYNATGSPGTWLGGDS